MRSVKQVFRLLSVSLYGFFHSKKFVIFLLVAFLFSAYTFWGLNDIAAFYHMNVSVCVFPFLVSNPSMLLIFGALVIYLFSDLPFTEENTCFVLIRTNRSRYYLAKIFYIFVVSAVIAATFVLFSILCVLPHGDFSDQWGKILYTLSADTMSLLEQVHTQIGFGVNEFILNHFTPWTAMAYSFVLMTLAVFFMGVVILFASVMVSKKAGCIAGGFFVSLSYFSMFLGYITFHGILYYISPFSWCSLNFLDISNTGLVPDPTYAVLVIVCFTAVLEIIAFLKFSRRDLKFY